MALLDKLNKVAKELTEKTGDVIETTKLTSKIHARKADINEEYRKIGEMVYKQYVETKVVDDMLIDSCKKIEELNQMIKELQEEIDSIKEDDLICPICGKENDKDSTECDECGHKFAGDIIEDNRCPSCGAIYEKGTKVCPICGVKLI